MTAVSESWPGHDQIIEAIERFEGRGFDEGRETAEIAIIALIKRFNPGWGWGIPAYVYRGNYYQESGGQVVKGPVIDLGNGEGA